MEPERCGGCEMKASKHPWVAVMNAADAEAIGATALTETSPKGFVAVSVCNACYLEPAHRVHPLKAHFFPRGAAQSAARLAGAQDVGM